MNITVIGTGYVGLTTAVSLAMQGHVITGVDINQTKIEMLKRGQVPIYEPDVDKYVLRLLDAGHIQFVSSEENDVKQADVIFICVGTPSDKYGHADLTFLYQVVTELQENFANETKDKVIIVKSTVPVGTTNYIASLFEKQKNIHVVSNPEFLREGTALQDALAPNRIVIGASSEFAYKVMDEVYAKISSPIIRTTRPNAEMIKYASNAFLATRISYMNELARLCETVGADVTIVAKGMGLDQRIGRDFLRAGLGYGGSCFPKDTAALFEMAKEKGVEMSILQSVMAVNETQPTWFVSKLLHTFTSLKKKKIALLGLAFKPDTDDIREAPSLKLIDHLHSLGAEITAYDPVATENMQALFNTEVHFVASPYEAVDGADAVILVTEWKECTQVDWRRVKKLMAQPYLFDGRNALPKKMLEEIGFLYKGVGIAAE